MEREAIGLFGLGLLGTAIAQRLLGAGYPVIGFDPDSDKGARLSKLGGSAAASPREVAARCATVVLAVFDTSQVEQVVEGADGLIGSAVRRAIAMSTCDPDRIQALAARVAERGLALIECPVSGSSTQVADGEAVALTAGDSNAVEAVAPIIEAICPRRHYLGTTGNGGRAKLVINLILGLNRAAVSEGLAFAESLGLERARLLDVARGSAAYSQVMDVKGVMWAQNRFAPPMSRVDQSLKDFELMNELGARTGQQLPFASLYAEMMRDCVANGEAALDNAIIINAVRRRKRGDEAA